ncbi:mandelate racemase/muconate lactonizing enzyme family protein [Mycobacterium sp. NPDC003449]
MIDSITTHHISLPLERELRTAIHRINSIENVLVEISSEGLRGIGYAFTFNKTQAHAVRHMVHDLAESLVGADDRSVRAHYGAMAMQLNFTGNAGIGMLGLSALDTALWDLHARRADMPLFRLLGGDRTALPVYATGGWTSYPVDQLVEEGLAYRERGYRYYKIKIGMPDWRDDVERVHQLRSALGDEMRLQVDANQAWNRLDALNAGRAFEEAGVHWYEEPISAADIEGSAELARTLDVPIATGETVHGLAGFRALVEGGAADVLMPDVMRVGGVTGFLEVAGFAAAHHQVVSSHTFTEVSAHIMASLPNATLVEHIPGWWDRMFEDAPEVTGGDIHLTERSGLGFTFSEATVKEFAQSEPYTIRPGT